MIVLTSLFGQPGYSTGTLSHSSARARTVQDQRLLNWVNSYDESMMADFAREHSVSFS